MPSEDIKILELHKHQKSEKVSFITYADLACLIDKIDGCKSDPENSSTTKVEWTYSIKFFSAYNITI